MKIMIHIEIFALDCGFCLVSHDFIISLEKKSLKKCGSKVKFICNINRQDTSRRSSSCSGT